MQNLHFPIGLSLGYHINKNYKEQRPVNDILGNSHGLAGKKMELLPRKIIKSMQDQVKKPGLSEWLSTVKEIEKVTVTADSQLHRNLHVIKKHIVHSFISRISEANRLAEPSRPNSSPAGLSLGNKVVKSKTGSDRTRYYAPSTAQSTSLVIKPRSPLSSVIQPLPIPPKFSAPTDATYGKLKETAKSENNGNKSEQGQAAEGRVTEPHTKTSRPRSRPPRHSNSPKLVQKITRPRSVPVQCLHSAPLHCHYKCNSCEACKKNKLKKMIDEMSGEEIASYYEFLDGKNCNSNKTLSNQTCRRHKPAYVVIDDDYLHHGSAFQNVRQRDKGYFTIHPQFVSENTVELKTMKMKYHKLIEKSKIPVF